MRLGLRMGLNSRQGGGSALDPDARLYIAAVETALETPIATALPSATSNPKRIISDFIKAEKAASRWSLHKRIYLPIYNNAAASAIDMVSRLSGTFTGLGSVTHAAGYVQGNGTSGYFDFNSTATSLGITNASACFAALVLQAPTNNSMGHVGSYASSSSSLYLGTSTTVSSLRFDCANETTGRVESAIPQNNGIMIGCRSSGTRFIASRKGSGYTQLATITNASAGTIPTGNLVGMGIAPSIWMSNARYGIFSVGMGISNSESESFTSNLKTLWESLTGLSLP